MAPSVLPQIGTGPRKWTLRTIKAKDSHLLLFFLKTFQRLCFSLSDVPECQSPSTEWQGHRLRFGGHLCYSLTSSCAPGELTKPSAFCGQFIAARHYAPRSPISLQYIFQEGGKNGFKASPAGIRRWHQEVSPVPEKRTLVAVP